MHCGLRFKYHIFSHLVVNSTEFVEVTVKVSTSRSPLVAIDAVSYILLSRILPWESLVSSHNLASRVRAIVCSENDLLFES